MKKIISSLPTAFLIIAIVVTLALVCNLTPNRWEMGDRACFVANGKPVTVQWYSRESKFAGRPTNYTVLAVNDLNQVYEVDVRETDLTECETAK